MKKSAIRLLSVTSQNTISYIDFSPNWSTTIATLKEAQTYSILSRTTHHKKNYNIWSRPFVQLIKYHAFMTYVRQEV
jgi:hypothetical protein